MKNPLPVKPMIRHLLIVKTVKKPGMKMMVTENKYPSHSENTD
jgi:hypothetical protein